MVINIVRVGQRDRALQREFIQFPHRLYADCPYWVPFFNIDMRNYLRKKHPYFKAYAGDFFLAKKGSESVGTIEVSYNHNYIKMHKINTAHFFFFDFIDDYQVAEALIQRAAEWAQAHGAEYLSGPMLSGGPLGSGILIEGYDYPATMTMMRYNYSYYQRYLEKLGFVKIMDLYSYFVEPKDFKMNSKVERIVQLVKKRGHFQSMVCRNRRELIAITKKMVHELFNVVLGDHLENYPMTSEELKQLVRELVMVARTDLARFITYKGEIVGYVVGFPDITPELQRADGSINPLSLWRILRAVRHPQRITLNGVGILPQYQKLGGNALLYSEMSKATQATNPVTAELTQIAETTEVMVQEMALMVDKRIKVHRLMKKKIS